MKRLKRLLALPLFDDLDVVLVLRREDVFYLSGFTGEGFLLISKQEFFLITDFRYIVQAHTQTNGWSIVESERGDTLDTVCGLIRDNHYCNIGIEKKYISLSGYEKISNELETVFFTDIDNCFEQLRAIKEPEEIRSITKAAQIADMGFQMLLRIIHPGMTEKDAQIELAYQCGKLGSEGFGFDFIVASGPNGAMPHAVPGNRMIQSGDLVTVDMGCLVNGYSSDMTRTFAVGEPSQELQKIYNIVLESQLCGLEALKPWINGKEVDAAARKVIHSAGYGTYFGHALGHGVGLMVHELPRLSPRIDMVLKPGMVVTVEPGIYIPNLGGVRIEDLCIITEEGYLNLCSSSKDLIII